MTRVFIDEITGWQPVGHTPTTWAEIARQGRKAGVRFESAPLAPSYHDTGIAVDLTVPSSLTISRAYDPRDAAMLARVDAMVDRVANRALARQVITVAGRAHVRQVDRRWPRRSGRRRHDESRAHHAGRRAVATAMRRRLRRLGIGPTRLVEVDRTVTMPNMHLHAEVPERINAGDVRMTWRFAP